MMAFKFNPQSEEEVLNLLPEGIYKFQIKNSENCVSKAGNPMIKLSLAIWDKNGTERTITDYLLAAMMYKVKHFCESVGLDDKYKSGELHSNDCIGKTGECKIKMDKSEGYAPKNSVQDYVKKSEKVTNILANKEDDDAMFDENEDLPF